MTLKKGALLVLVLIIAIFGVYLRVQNLKFLEGKYLVGSDPYRYFRQTRLIVEEGELPDIERARNFPDGLNLSEQNTFFPKLLAAFYMLTHSIFPSVSLHQILSLYPPIAIGIALIFLFLLTHRLFGRLAALLALLLLAALPVFSQRTHAGYIDTDALIILLLFAGIYFYSLSFGQSFGVSELIFAGLAGGIIGVLNLVWWGGGMVSFIFCAFQLLISWERNYTKEDFYRFLCWFLPTVLVIVGFGTSYWKNLQATFTVLALYVPLAMFCVIVVIFFLQRSPRWIGLSQRLRLSIGLVVSLSLLCVGVLVFTLYSRDFSWVEGLIQHLRYPYGKNGVMEFVSELQPTTWQNWQKSYGIIGLTTFAGFFLITYNFYPRNLLRSLIHASIGGMGLLMIASVGNIPQSEILGFFSIQSTLILLGNFCLFVSLATTAGLRHQTDSSTPTHVGKFHLILIVWFIIVWNLASAAVRFHLFLAPIAAILTCHFFSWLLEKTMPLFSRFRLQFLLGLILLAWLALINASDIISFGIQIVTFGKITTSFSGHTQFLITVLTTAVLFGPILQEILSLKAESVSILRVIGTIGIVVLIWLNVIGLYALGSVERAVIWEAQQGRPYPNKVVRTACEWLKANLPEDAVIAADWGIGSVINELGEQNTIIDEEQNIPRILEMVEKFSRGTEATALEFLQKYGGTHLLLSLDEIGGLSIYSAALTPSTETYIVPFRQSPEHTPEIWHFTPLAKSFMPAFQLDNIDCQQDDCLIKSISVPLTLENHLLVETPPEIVIQRQDEDQILTAKEVIIGEQSWYFPEGQLNGTVWCAGNMNGRTFQNYLTIYLPEVVREWFLVKLFLGEHSDRFKLVYESDASNRLQVKIWEVQSDEKAREYNGN